MRTCKLKTLKKRKNMNKVKEILLITIILLMWLNIIVDIYLIIKTII
jgi:hypothetical protein